MGKWKSSKQDNVNILKDHPPLGVKTVTQMPDSYSTTGKLRNLTDQNQKTSTWQTLAVPKNLPQMQIQMPFLGGAMRLWYQSDQDQRSMIGEVNYYSQCCSKLGRKFSACYCYGCSKNEQKQKQSVFDKN